VHSVSAVQETPPIFVVGAVLPIRAKSVSRTEGSCSFQLPPLSLSANNGLPLVTSGRLPVASQLVAPVPTQETAVRLDSGVSGAGGASTFH